jgi:sugar phosphate isomerase/epimerase
MKEVITKMKKNELVINTLVFASDYKNGVTQTQMMDILKNVGITKVEVRREFMKDIEKENKEIGEKAKENHMDVFYSVPEYLYIDKKLQLTSIEQYFKEAKDMGCHRVKVATGDYGTVKQEDMAALNSLLEKYEIKLTVENDQTKENGRIGMTFDIGNWIWQKEDPLNNAKRLSEYVSYIHLKDVADADKPYTTYLNEGGIGWRSVMDVLPSDVPLALEYPCGDQTAKQLEKEIRKVCNE